MKIPSSFLTTSYITIASIITNTVYADNNLRKRAMEERQLSPRIGQFSCCKDDACIDFYGNVLIDQQCKACTDVNGTIGEMSCTAYLACQHMSAEGIVKFSSCTGIESCLHNSGTIEIQACEGDYSCGNNNGTIADHTCSGEDSCHYNSGTIHDSSCNGKEACFAENSGVIGSDSCNSDYSCPQNRGFIGNSACNGNHACQANAKTGKIGNSSCGNDDACDQNSGLIGDDACNGKGACPGNTGVIDIGCCKKDNYHELCDNNDKYLSCGGGTTTVQDITVQDYKVFIILNFNGQF